MANLSITLKTQTVNVFGPSPTNNWNAMVWGTDTWGMKAAGSAGLPAIVKEVDHQMTTQALSVSESLAFTPTKILQQQTLSFATHNVASLTVFDGRGYLYVYAGPSTDAETHPVPVYSTVTCGVTGWTTVAVASTSWS